LESPKKPDQQQKGKPNFHRRSHHHTSTEDIVISNTSPE
jgi:hypothetical protein